MNTKHLSIILIFATTLYGTIVYDDLKPSVTDTYDLGSSSLEWQDGYFAGDLAAVTFSGDGSALTGIASGTGGVINTGSTTIGADSDSDDVGILVLQTRGTTRLTVANNGDIVIAGTITGGTWNGTAIDISSYTNLVAGTNITLSGDTLNVDDAFLVNNASDTMAGVLTNNGLTITTGNALTLGVTQWDDGSDKINGEQIADDTIDGDSLDFADITLADFTVDIASTSLTDTASLLYETELDTFSELQAQIADKTLLNEEDTATIDSLWTFSSGITGTVSNATALATARSFSVSGDVATSSSVSFDGTGNVNLAVSFDSEVIENADISPAAAISADKLATGTTNAIVTNIENTERNAHLSSSGSSHSYIDQDVTSSSSPTFDNTNMTGNISVFTNDSGYVTATLTDEEMQDVVGAMTTGNTETLISVDYQDSDGTIDFVVDEAAIDHDALTNFTANEHFLQSAINTVGTITSGTWNAAVIQHEYGGLEADVSGYTGLLAISSGSTSEVDALSELEAQIADVTAFVVEGTAVSDIEGTGLSITAGTLNWGGLVTDTTPQLGGDLDGQSLYDLTNMVHGTFSGTGQFEHIASTDDIIAVGGVQAALLYSTNNGIITNEFVIGSVDTDPDATLEIGEAIPPTYIDGVNDILVSDDVEIQHNLYVVNDANFFGDVNIPSGEVLIISSTTPQLTIGSDTSNVFTYSVSAGGNLTMAAIGGIISFSDEAIGTTGTADFGATQVDSLVVEDGLIVDTTTLVVDDVNHIVEIGSADGSDKIKAYHTNTDAYVKWNDGGLYFITDEGTNTDTSVFVKGKGTGNAAIGIADGEEVMSWRFYAYNDGAAYLNVFGSAPTKVSLVSGGNVPIRMFEFAAEGETQKLQLYGRRTGDSAIRHIDFGISPDVNDTAQITGVSNYYIDGNVGIGTTAPDSIFHIKANVAGEVGSHPAGQLIIQDPDDTVFGNAVITGYESDGAGNPDQQLWYLGSSSSGNSNIIFLNRRNSKLQLGTNGVSRLTILGNGNVGIGTVTPTAALQMGDDKLIALDVNAGLTASTTQSQGQGALTAQINEVSTVANKDDTVTLPSAITGVEIEIINNGVNTLQIFPASGDDLSLGVNTAQELEANERVKFVAYDTTNWAKESTTEIIHAEIHDEDNTDAFVINDAGGDFHSYHTNGFAAGDLADWTFDAGGAGTSFPIASIADGADSGVDIAVTTTGLHGLEVGDIISQTNLANAAYVGIFVVKAIISTTVYEVAAVYTADGTGTMDQAATLEADAVAAGVYSFAYYISGTPVGNNETFDFQLYKEATAITGTKVRRKFGAGGDFGSAPGGGIGAVADGEKISFALSNEDSAANFIIRNLTIVLIRL